MRCPTLVAGAMLMGLALASCGFAAGPAPAADSAGAKAALAVDQLIFCAAIKDKQPAGVCDTFPADIYSVYCYTRVFGTKGDSAIKHVWYRGASKQGEVKLAVRSLPWRTWSSKEMRKEWKGEWRVDVVTSDGALLASKKFFLR